VTDSPEQADFSPILRDIARASGHELRNALNALVVNLEVVRSRTLSLDDSVRLFVGQSVEQAEESVSVAEATIALLNLVVGAIGEDGRVGASAADGGVRISTKETEVERLERALAVLATRNAVETKASGAAVILKSCSGPCPDRNESK
jgi:hypothetical protein